MCKTKNATCMTCSKGFEYAVKPGLNPPHYCSDACKPQATGQCHECGTACRGAICRACYRKRHAAPVRNCEVCGKEFQRTQRYKDVARACSKECGFVLSGRLRDKGTAERQENERASLRMASLKPCCVCERHFDSSGSNKVCCSLQCAKVKQRRDVKASRFGGYENWLNKPCADCGEPAVMVGRNKSKYCNACRKARKKALVAALISNAGHRCRHCGLMMSSTCDLNHERHAEIDHLLPRSRGGSNEPSNLEMICRKCNGLKSDFTAAEIVLVPSQSHITNSLEVAQVYSAVGGCAFSQV